MKSDFKPVVRNIKTNDIYFYEGENKFTNIRTGIGGVVSDEAAAKTFIIASELSVLLNEFPTVADFISRLNLITVTE